MFNSESAKQARAKVSSLSCSLNGKKGYAALVKCGKEDIAKKKAAEWRMNHPSCLEKAVINWLNELNVSYSREKEIDKFYADFVINNLVIEVNGAQWHEKEELRQGQKAKDSSKYQTFNKLGYNVLILSEASIKNGEAKQQLYKLFGEKNV